MRKAFLPLIFALAAIATPVGAQTTSPESIVSIYRAAPGHQHELLKWFAQQDIVAKSAGVEASRLYVHREGASWDFVWIQPATTDAQDKAMEAAAKKLGHVTGPKMGLMLRQHIAEHSDTLAAGPMTAAEWLKIVGE